MNRHLKLYDDLGITHQSLIDHFSYFFSSGNQDLVKRFRKYTLTQKPMDFSVDQLVYMENLMASVAATGALHGVRFINDLTNNPELLKKFIECHVENNNA